MTGPMASWEDVGVIDFDVLDVRLTMSGIVVPSVTVPGGKDGK